MKPEDIKDFTQEQLTDLNILREAFKANTEVEKTVLINAILARSKEFRCHQVVQSLITAIKKDIENQIKENRRKANNRTEFNYPGRDEMDCGSWIADEEGVKILVDYNETTVCYHPIFPLERLFNIETKTEKIKLAYKRDNHWKDITVDKDLIASSSKIVKLAAYGIAVTSENAKGLVKYLSDIENLNEGKISLKTSTSKFGWHGDDFIPFDTKVIFDDESRFKELSDSLRPRGSYEIWLDLTRRIRKNITHNEPQIYLAASFASVLISKLNMLPFIVNLWGSTGKGKTVALMLAASVWADPSEGKYITDSYATQNAFEIRLDILNHLPLMLDDLSKVKDKCDDNFTDLVYLLCSGRGKDRSNIDLGLNKVKTWQNTILSNMERPLANETMRGGAINRILDFEMQEGYIFQNGNAVVETLKDNYGFAGPKFLDFIKEIGTEAINNLRKDFEQKIKDEAKRQDSEKEEKQILPLSLLLTADKLATDCLFEDGIYLDLEWMVSQLKDVDEVSEGQRAYDAIIQTVQMNPTRFDEAVPGEHWGFINGNQVNISPLVVKSIAKSENFSVKAFCSWAKKKRLLFSNNDRNQNVIYRDKKAYRYYTIALPVQEDKDEEFHEPDMNELPFD